MQYDENPSQKSVTVGTTNAVLSEDCFAERTFFSIVNTSTEGQVISISFGQQATVGSGIVIYPGGFYSEQKDNPGQQIMQKQVCVISNLAGGTVAFSERVTRRVQ